MGFAWVPVQELVERIRFRIFCAQFVGPWVTNELGNPLTKGYIAAPMTFVGGYCGILANPRLLQSMEDCLGRGLEISMSPRSCEGGVF